MEEDDLERKLNAIVGKALQGLVASGANAEFIGNFAASHRADIAQLLGIRSDSTQSAISADDIAAIARAAADTAVEKALERFGLGRKRPASTRVNVKIAGRRTSVSIGQEVFDRVVEARGSVSGAKHLVRNLAENIPPGGVENNSVWVEERLEMSLNFSAATPVIEAPKH